MLLLLVATSCAITTETSVTCWKHRLCVGDTYTYNHAPNGHGGYYVTEVQIAAIKGNRCQVIHRNGEETWVECTYLEDYSTPLHVRQQPNKKEHKEHKQKKNKY